MPLIIRCAFCKKYEKKKIFSSLPTGWTYIVLSPGREEDFGKGSAAPLCDGCSAGFSKLFPDEPSSGPTEDIELKKYHQPEFDAVCEAAEKPCENPEKGTMGGPFCGFCSSCRAGWFLVTLSRIAKKVKEKKA